jgi:hypothetical protein
MKENKLKELFNSHYQEPFTLLRSLKVVKQYEIKKEDELLYIQILHGKGLFKTDVYIIRALEKVNDEYIKRLDLLKAYHKKEAMKKYLKELNNGGS